MNISKFCVIAFLLLILCYLIVLLSLFALEINIFRNLRALQLNYTSIQIDGYSDSLLKSYKLVTLDPINFIYTIPSNSSSCENNDEIVTFYSKKTVTVCLCPYASHFYAHRRKLRTATLVLKLFWNFKIGRESNFAFPD